MKFDVLIIGGDLAGLTYGIRLQKNGVKCAIISTPDKVRCIFLPVH